MRAFIAASAFAIAITGTVYTAQADGGGSNAYAYETSQQVRRHDYRTQFDQNGQVVQDDLMTGSLRAPGLAPFAPGPYAPYGRLRGLSR